MSAQAPRTPTATTAFSAPASPATPPPAPAPRRASTRRRRAGAAAAAWEVVHPHAAGIDIGAREHWVSVGAHRPGENRRAFGTTTPELHELVAWLQSHAITHVAMESTGLYWLPVYEVLEAAGFAVILADARQTKHTAGRKSDLTDCEWIAQLHAYGLLRAAFRPTDAICRLRTLQRHRQNLVAAVAQSLHHLQQALDGMNLHVHHALAHLGGKSGLAMIDAILAGERDPARLAALADRRVKKSQAELVAALTGNYREEEIFVLGQARASHRHLEGQIAACDEEIDRQLEALAAACPPPPAAEATAAPKPQRAKRQPGRRPVEAARVQNLTGWLHQLFGVDLTQVPGLGVLGVLTLLSELGPDLRAWRHAGAFASWLGLCPNHRISGGQVLSARTRKVVNRAATVLRMAALSAGRTDTPLGAFYRRKAAQFGAPKAITATAHKLARLIYTMVRTGQEYRATSASAYQKRYDEQRFKAFRRRAQQLGYELVPKAQAA